jgi:hypothetical protein
MIRNQQKRSSTDNGMDLLNGNEVLRVRGSTMWLLRLEKRLESKWVALLLL